MGDSYCRLHFRNLGILSVPCVYILYCYIFTKANPQSYPPNSDRHNHSTRNREITGAGNGLGRIMSQQLLDLGCKVIGVDVREEDLKDAKEIADSDPKRKGNMEIYVCDISDRSQVTKLREDVLKRFGSIDILINNAAIVYRNNFSSGDDEHIEKVCKVNILGGYWVTREFLPGMQELGKGHIVFISSLSAIFPHPDLAIYSATKCATTALATSLRELLEDSGQWKNIKVTTVHPTIISTSQVIEESFTKSVVSAMPTNHAARCVIQALRNDLEDVSIPGFTVSYYIQRLLTATPVLQKAINSFLKVKFREVSKSHFDDLITNNKSYKTLNFKPSSETFNLPK